MWLKDDTVKRRAIFISVLDVCKYKSAMVNTFKLEWLSMDNLSSPMLFDVFLLDIVRDRR